MKAFRISSGSGTIRGQIRLPSSKSLSNRALIINALSGNEIAIHELSEADDTLLLEQLLQKISVHHPEEAEMTLDCKNAGTVFRFLAAYLSVTPGNWYLTGSGRMMERPVGQLTSALAALGAEISHAGTDGYPPLRIRGAALEGGRVAIDAGISSQFISALLMIAPVLPKGLDLRLQGRVISKPYIDMTLGLLKKAGIDSQANGNQIEIEHQDFANCEFFIEPDWSSAAFWFELVALAKDGEVFLEGLQKESLQGDALLPVVFEPLGVATTFDKKGIRLNKSRKSTGLFTFDFTDHPDLAQAVITTCAGLRIPGRFTGLESLRIKETDRIAGLKKELSKTGAILEQAGHSVLELFPDRVNLTELHRQPPVFNSWNDHRMAMALAPLSVVFGSVIIEDPDVVIKSYPRYWDNLAECGIKINIT